jgi:hypothetical protein
MKIPTWLLVATGLLMNIAAALITNFYIDRIQIQQNDNNNQQVTNQKLIELTWQQMDTLERKRESALLALLQSSIQPALETSTNISNSLLIKQLEKSLHQYDKSLVLKPFSQENAPLWSQSITDIQQQLGNKIDDIFIENIELKTQQHSLMTSISKLRNLALFLQILGLALILARDLKR